MYVINYMCSTYTFSLLRSSSAHCNIVDVFRGGVGVGAECGTYYNVRIRYFNPAFIRGKVLYHVFFNIVSNASPRASWLRRFDLDLKMPLLTRIFLRFFLLLWFPRQHTILFCNFVYVVCNLRKCPNRSLHKEIAPFPWTVTHLLHLQIGHASVRNPKAWATRRTEKSLLHKTKLKTFNADTC